MLRQVNNVSLQVLTGGYAILTGGYIPKCYRKLTGFTGKKTGKNGFYRKYTGQIFYLKWSPREQENNR